MSGYFKTKEFKCPCCGKVKVSAYLLHLLNKEREGYGKPIIVSSGYRCKKRNKYLGGKDNSAHLKGAAADIKCTNSVDRMLLLDLALEVGFKRIGIAKEYNGDENRGFIHLDVDDSLPQRVLWIY